MPSQLREYRVLLERVPHGERAVDPDALGLRSKLGGAPDWDQNDETPLCPGCGQPMVFVGQIDSVEHHDDQNPHSISPFSHQQEYMFGDVGMLYVFFCKSTLVMVSASRSMMLALLAERWTIRLPFTAMVA